MKLLSEPLWQGALIMSVASLLATMQNALVKLIGHQVSTVEVIFIQYAVCLVFLLPMIIKTAGKVLITKSPVMSSIRTAVGVFYFLSMFYALKFLPIFDVALLSCTAPLWATLVSWLFFKTKVKLATIGGIILGFLGVACILHPDQHIFSWASLIALSAGLFGGINVIFIGRISKTTTQDSILSFYFLGTTLILAPAALFHWQWPSWTVLALLIGNGAILYLRQILVYIGLKKAPHQGNKLAVIVYLNVIFSALAGWVFWKESLTSYDLIGAVLTIAGGYITLSFQQKKTGT